MLVAATQMDIITEEIADKISNFFEFMQTKKNEMVAFTKNYEGGAYCRGLQTGILGSNGIKSFMSNLDSLNASLQELTMKKMAEKGATQQ